MMRRKSLPVGAQFRIRIVCKGALHIALNEEIFVNVYAEPQAGAGYPAMIMKVSTVGAAQDGGDRVRYKRPGAEFADSTDLEILPRKHFLPFDNIRHQVIVPIGML